MKTGFEDRILGFALPPEASDESPCVSAIEPGPGGWKLTRRGLMALLATGAFAANAQTRGAAACSVGAYAHQILIDSLGFLPGGKTLVSAGRDRLVKFWTIPSAALYRAVSTSAAPLQLAVSPDGKWIAVAMEGGALEIWPSTGASRRALSGHTASVTGVAFTPDSSQLVSVSQDRTTRVWSVSTAQPLHTFADSSDVMAAVAVPPSGSLVTSGAQLHLRSLSTGAILKTVPGKAFAISRDGKFLAAHDGARLHMYAFPSLNQLVAVVDKHDAASLSFSADGRLLAVAYADTPARIFYAPGLTPKLTLDPNEGPCLSTSTSPAALPAGRPAPVSLPHPAERPGSLPPPQTGYLAVSSGKSIRLYTLPDGARVPVCFMDLAASEPASSGTQYFLNGVLYTISCGGSLPTGAECTCNCVPGNCPCVFDTGCSCDSDVGCSCVSDSGCSCVSDTGCSCVSDTGCSCVSDTGCSCVGDTGCSCVSDTGCSCVGDVGCSCDSDYGCGCVDDFGCSCDSDTGCGCVSDSGCGCDSDMGCSCDSDMGCGCVDE